MLTGAETTREKLMRAALEIVAEDGFGAATTAAIAERAGYAEGTLYRHFKGKEELLIEAYRQYKSEVFDRAYEAYDASETPRARFKSLWMAIFHALRADPDASMFGARFAESSLSSKEGGMAHESMNATLGTLIEDARKSGEIKGLRPELLRTLFYAPITALLKGERQGETWSGAEIEAAADSAWDSWRNH